jgi:hypothetical protein
VEVDVLLRTQLTADIVLLSIQVVVVIVVVTQAPKVLLLCR